MRDSAPSLSASTDRHFDAIIVGARIAGCAVAFQLARRGWRVALLEKHPLPLSAPLSLPLVYARALEQFRSLGLMPALDPVLSTLTPIRSISLRYDNELVLGGNLPEWAGFSDAYILPRAQVDNALLTFILQQDYPAGGSITLLAQHRVEQLLRRDHNEGPVIGVRAAVSAVSGDGASGSQGTPERAEYFAPLVIGADGRLSRIAALLGEEATPYVVTPACTTFCYTFCRGIERAGLPDGYMVRAKDHRILVLSEMEPGLQTLGIYLPSEQYAVFRGHGQPDPVRSMWAEWQATWESVPELSGRMHHIELLGKVLGLDPRYGAGYFRPVGGPGWALVGDAAHFKDPASSQGLHDALFTVHLLVEALDQVHGSAPLTGEAAWKDWPMRVKQVQQHRDAALQPLFDFTNIFSRLLTHPPSRKEYALLRCLAEDSVLMEHFLGIFMGGTSFEAFRREVAQYLRRRLLAHGLNLIGWKRDLAHLFHKSPASLSSPSYPMNPTPTLSGVTGSSPPLTG